MPWVAVGGYRNVAALCCYTLQDSNPDRTLCLLTNGGLSIAVNLKDCEAVRRFRDIPIMSVNGTECPYVEDGGSVLA